MLTLFFFTFARRNLILPEGQEINEQVEEKAENSYHIVTVMFVRNNNCSSHQEALHNMGVLFRASMLNESIYAINVSDQSLERQP